MATFHTVILAVMSAALVQGQRPSFAGTRPIGFPELPKTTADPLGNRFGESDGTTERLPIEAKGDRDLVNRISKFPVDQQPFWYLNWKALEEQRKNPQTYPQRPSQFAETPNFNFGNSGTLNSNTGTLNSNAGTLNSNAGTLNSNAGTLNSNAGTLNSNAGTLNSNAGTLNSNTGTLNSNAGTLNSNDGILNSNAGTLNSNAGTLNSNIGTQQSNSETNSSSGTQNSGVPNSNIELGNRNGGIEPSANGGSRKQYNTWVQGHHNQMTKSNQHGHNRYGA